MPLPKDSTEMKVLTTNITKTSVSGSSAGEEDGTFTPNEDVTKTASELDENNNSPEDIRRCVDLNSSVGRKYSLDNNLSRMKAYMNPRNKESRQYTSSSEDLSDAELNDIDENKFFRPDETCDETTDEIQKNLTSIRNQFNSIATITEREKVQPENDSSRSEDKHIEDEVISHFGNNINGDEIEDEKTHWMEIKQYLSRV